MTCMAITAPCWYHVKHQTVLACFDQGVQTMICHIRPLVTFQVHFGHANINFTCATRWFKQKLQFAWQCFNDFPLWYLKCMYCSFTVMAICSESGNNQRWIQLGCPGHQARACLIGQFWTCSFVMWSHNSFDPGRASPPIGHCTQNLVKIFTFLSGKFVAMASPCDKHGGMTRHSGADSSNFNQWYHWGPYQNTS